LSDELRTLLKATKKGQKALSFQQLAKALTLVEELGIEAFENLCEVSAHSLRIGITGPPGAGKSTLINGLIEEFRKKNLVVGVLAIDPSSPFTGGAILGDRIRYVDHGSDPAVFIRSVSSRGALGGVSGSTYLMARVFDHFRFDVLIVETVGVGQTELEIMNVADVVALVVPPEFGDGIQAIKAGILEIADCFIVNKADRPGAEVLANELRTWAADENVPLYQTIATRKTGLKDLVEFFEKKRDTQSIEQERLVVSRLRAEAAALVRMKMETQIRKKMGKINSKKDQTRFILSQI
jgi:LAO/AO transport system kinase